MMKYTNKITLLTFILLFFISITANAFKIAAILPNALDERWVLDTKSMQNKAYTLGFEILVFYGNNTLESQIKLVDRAVMNGVDVIILAVNDPVGSGILIEKAAANGIKVVTYLNPPDAPNNISMYVAFDYTKSGYDQIEYTFNRIPFGTYLFIMGSPTDNLLLDIYAGSVKALKTKNIRDDINVVSKIYDSTWHYSNMKDFFKKSIIEYGDISVIIIPDDKMAIAAVDAIKELGLSKQVFVSGQNITMSSAGYILEGIEIMSTYLDQNVLTVAAVDIAYSIVTSDKITSNDNGRPIIISGVTVPTYYVYPKIIDENNIWEEIFNKGYMKLKDINKLNSPKQ